MARPDRKEDIFKAALACFNEHGYHGASLDMIAEKGNISKGGIYYHFKSKDELYLQLFAYRCERYLEQATAAVEQVSDPAERIDRFIDTAAKIVQQNQDFLRFLIEFMGIGLRDPAIGEAMATYYTASVKNFTAMINAGIDAGIFLPVDAELIARRVYFMSAGLFFSYFTAHQKLDLVHEHIVHIRSIIESIKTTRQP